MGRVFKDKQVDLLLTLWCISFLFCDQLYNFVFGEFYLLSALSPHTAGGKKISRLKKKTFFVIESLHSCQMICT